MSSKPKCQAKVPSECYYHGVHSVFYTKMLRNKMLVARSVNAAAKTDNEKLEAYMHLQDAEELYYGTEEGRTALMDNIRMVKDGDLKSHWEDVLTRADTRREFIETGVQQFQQHPVPANPWAPKPKPVQVRKPLTTVSSTTMRRTEKLPSGETVVYEWDKNSHAVHVEIVDDVDSMRRIGSASSQDKAETLISEWHARYQQT